MKNNIKKRKLLLRLFSLVFSFFIWLYVISSAEVLVQKDIPVEIEIAQGYSIASLSDSSVNLKIKGPRVFVRKYLDGNQKIFIQLKDYYKEGQKNYKVTVNQFKFGLPFGIELVEFNPKNIDFSISKTITKKVPIFARIDPKIKLNYEMKNLIVIPKEVSITGAKSLLRKIDKVETKFIEEEKVFSGERHEVELEKNQKFVIFDRHNAVVSYKLNSKISEFTFMNIPIIFQSEKLIKDTSVKNVKVVVKGLKTELKDELKNKIRVLARVPTTASTNLEVELSSEVPDKLELIEIIPNKIMIKTE